jgi:flagellar assembly factor FliW
MSFIVVDPKFIKSDYHIDLTDYDVGLLQGDSVAEKHSLEVYCIVSVEEGPLLISANLLGPLLINVKLGIGRQVVLTNTDYSTRHIVVG